MDKKQLRNGFRNDVYERDKHECRVCGRKDGKLDAHHITDRTEMPNGGYVKENGITLCSNEDGCHLKAEKFHMSDNKEWVKGYHPDDLYKLIGSSYEEAFLKSEALCQEPT